MIWKSFIWSDNYYVQSKITSSIWKLFVRSENCSFDLTIVLFWLRNNSFGLNFELKSTDKVCLPSFLPIENGFYSVRVQFFRYLFCTSMEIPCWAWQREPDISYLFNAPKIDSKLLEPHQWVKLNMKQASNYFVKFHPPKALLETSK